MAVDRGFIALLGVARHNAHPRSGRLPGLEPDIERTRRSTADPNPAAPANDSVIGRSLGHGQVERDVGEDAWRIGRSGVIAEPRGHDLDDPIAHAIRRQGPAVEEDRVGPGGAVLALVTDLADRLGPMPPQKGAQVLGHGRIGHERQAELLQSQPRPALRLLVAVGPGKVTIERNCLNVLPRQLRLDAAADDPRAASGDGHRPPLQQRLLLDEQLFLGGPAGKPQGAPLLGVEPNAAQLLLDLMRQGKVDVVAAEHEVVAHGDAAESRPGQSLDHGDQTEVGRAAADVADQDQLAGTHLALPAVLVRDDPAIKRRLRLFEQRDRGQIGLLGGLECQLPSRLVERGRHGQYNLLLFQPPRRVILGKVVIPGVADVPQVGRRGFDGRDSLDLGRRAPRQDVGLPVHAGMTEPALGAADQAAGNTGPLESCELANDPAAAVAPGQPRRSGWKLWPACEIEERGEHAPGGRLAWRDKLRNVEHPDVGRRPVAPFRVHIRHCAVGRAQIDADNVP